ncbi:hypothetical protein CBL_05147 [Carabus blaptoides fortunei]
MHESEIQLNNKPGKVFATKGSKDVHVLTSVERGENLTVVTCCNAEGTFLPPVLIIKGSGKKVEHLRDLLPGSDIYINKQSSYINADLFLKWFKEHFLPRKSPGQALLIFDGHKSHCTAVPDHFFKISDVANGFVPPKQHDQNGTTQDSNAAIDVTLENKLEQNGNNSTEVVIEPFLNVNELSDNFLGDSDNFLMTPSMIDNNLTPTATESKEIQDSQVAIDEQENSAELESRSIQTDDFVETPSKYLYDIAPIPSIPQSTFNKRKRLAEVLTSQQLIQKKSKDNKVKRSCSKVKL